MSIRESMNEHRLAAVAIALALIVAGSIGLVMAARGSRANYGSGDMAWFTVDDGSTWFADRATRIPPFDHEGKSAVRCFVVKCDDGKAWVSHLMRYTAQGRENLEDQKRIQKFDPSTLSTLRRTMEVKPPRTGNEGWVSLEDPKAAAIQNPKCPHDGIHAVQPAEPSN